MRRASSWLGLSMLLCPWLTGCGPAPEKLDSGGVSLALTTQAAGVTYRLTDARFALKGPENRGLSSGAEEQLDLDLAPGAYTLELLAGWHLIKADDASAAPVDARLVSENPAPLLVEAGTTTDAVLRFQLADGTQLSNAKGQLSVGFSLGSGADAGAGASAGCVQELRVDELDYDQPSTDDAEFVEIVNTGSCEASLEGVVLELVDGAGGAPYARYELSKAAAQLASGQRLVVGDPTVVASLPANVPSLQLNGSGLQNGPDGLRLMLGQRILDAVAYEGPIGGLDEGEIQTDDEAELSLGRCPDGFDSNDNALDFRLLVPSPGEANVCPVTH